MLELSNFLLPSCWASVPLGGFVPDNRIESEVVLATKCMLEKEKRFYRKTSKSRAQVFTLCEHLQDPQLEKFLFSIHCSCQGDHSQSNASCPRGRHIPRNPLTVSTFVRQDAFGDINFFFFPSGLSRESYSFFFFRQNDVGSLHTRDLDKLPPPLQEMESSDTPQCKLTLLTCECSLLSRLALVGSVDYALSPCQLLPPFTKASLPYTPCLQELWVGRRLIIFWCHDLM